MSDTPLTDAASFWHREAPAHVPLGGRVVAESVAQALERQASRWQAVAKKLAETSREWMRATRKIAFAQEAWITTREIHYFNRMESAKLEQAQASAEYDAALAEYDSLTGAGAEND